MPGYMTAAAIGGFTLALVAGQALHVQAGTVSNIIFSGLAAAGVIGAVRGVRNKVNYKDALDYAACRERLAFLKDLKKKRLCRQSLPEKNQRRKGGWLLWFPQ